VGSVFHLSIGRFIASGKWALLGNPEPATPPIAGDRIGSRQDHNAAAAKAGAGNAAGSEATMPVIEIGCAGHAGGNGELHIRDHAWPMALVFN
jgi:hypothetical protein